MTLVHYHELGLDLDLGCVLVPNAAACSCSVMLRVVPCCSMFVPEPEGKVGLRLVGHHDH